MQHIQLLLPWPPSVNHYWGQAGKNRFISKRGKEFRASVIEACKDVKALEGRLAMHISVFPPDRRQRDLDNMLKALLDACEHAGCYESDSQIDELHIIRKEVKKGGECVILIHTL